MASWTTRTTSSTLRTTFESPFTYLVPHMFAYTFLGMVTETTATLNGEDKALHTENTAWTSKHPRNALQSRHKPFIEHIEKPQWLEDEIELRNNSLTGEAEKPRRAKNRKKAGAEKAGEPPSASDDELENAKPKPKATQERKWDPLNREVHEDPPRGHVDKFGEDFGGCEDKDRKVGVVACFMNQTQTRKNKHWWCVCDRAQNGHWVNTQGNHSDHSFSHPNAALYRFLRRSFCVALCRSLRRSLCRFLPLSAAFCAALCAVLSAALCCSPAVLCCSLPLFAVLLVC